MSLMQRRRALMAAQGKNETIWIIKDGVLQSAYAPLSNVGYTRGSGATIVSATTEDGMLKVSYSGGATLTGAQTGAQTTQAISVPRAGKLYVEGIRYSANTNYGWPGARFSEIAVTANTIQGAYGTGAIACTPATTLTVMSYDVSPGTWYLSCYMDRNSTSGRNQWIKLKNVWIEVG